VVWSEGLTEKRHGTFSNFFGTLWIGETVGIREAKKYAYVSERFIIEAYTPEAKSNPEIDSDGYEPIWVLSGPNGEYLPPELEPIKFIIETWIAAKTGKVHKKTAKEMDIEDKEAFDKDVKEIEEALEEHGSSTLMSQFHFGEAVHIHRGEK
jgi:hypothetical protein